MLLPLFLNLTGRDVVLVGGGRVAAQKLRQLVAVGARVRVVAPAVDPAIEQENVEIARRTFAPDDLDGAWLVVAAAPPDVNRQVAMAAQARQMFVNAVDDPANATAFLSGVVRRDGVTMAISTSGDAPALTSLLREALDTVLPEDLERWVAEAKRERIAWRRDQVPMDDRKPRLLEALNKLYDPDGRSGRLQPANLGAAAARPPEGGRYDGKDLRRGHVSLVGAGPGDPGLLTRKAIARLRAADLVLYDALIDNRILRYARNAQRFFVGKRAGRHASACGPREESESAPGAGLDDARRSARASESLQPKALGVGPQPQEKRWAPRAFKGMNQETIHGVMIRAARRGRRVVRLQGGDPFVFGRGGEEALALERAGVAFDVVPGVTSAVAAPALAGIPVTHRGLSSAFLVVSGHDETAFATAVHQVEPNGLTIVVLMGMARSAILASALIARGWSRHTPAAIIVDASGPEQQVWRGTLGELAADEVDLNGDRAGTIVIGEVVAVGMQAASVEAQKARAGR